MNEITLPRKKHSHRCRKCGQAVYCYKAQCTKPQRIDECQYCKPVHPIKLTVDTGREGIGSSAGTVRQYNAAIGTWTAVYSA